MLHGSPAALRLVALLPVTLLATACSGFATAPASPSAAPVPVAASAPPPEPAPDPALGRRVAELELQALEKDQQIVELQARLADARREVVRSMARLQSLATRAEAASGIAEAELALQSLPATIPRHAAEEIRELMRLSSDEFDEANFGGALYLANQAKSAATAARGQVAAADGSLQPSERALALPLNLATKSNANVRSGPGTRFAVLFTLPADAPVVAYSSAEQWLQIADDTGRRGWISQGLIRGRP
jgi:uncharacterized coiled-coil protein SlyX